MARRSVFARAVSFDAEVIFRRGGQTFDFEDAVLRGVILGENFERFARELAEFVIRRIFHDVTSRVVHMADAKLDRRLVLRSRRKRRRRQVDEVRRRLGVGIGRRSVGAGAVRLHAEMVLRRSGQMGNVEASDLIFKVFNFKPKGADRPAKIAALRIFHKVIFHVVARRVIDLAHRQFDRRRTGRRRRQRRRIENNEVRFLGRFKISRISVRFLADRLNAEVIRRRGGQFRNVEPRDLIRKFIRIVVVKFVRLNRYRFSVGEIGIQRIFHDVARRIFDRDDRNLDIRGPRRHRFHIRNVENDIVRLFGRFAVGRIEIIARFLRRRHHAEMIFRRR